MNYQDELQQIKKRREERTNRISNSADQLQLSDRDIRKSGVNPVTRQAITPNERGLSGALNLIGKDVTVGLEDKDTAGRSFVGNLGIGAVQTTVGSQGLVSTYQEVGKGLAERESREDLIRLQGQNLEISNRLMDAYRKETDPATRSKLIAEMQRLGSSTDELSAIVDDQRITGKDVITSGVESLSGAASIGIGGSAVSKASGLAKNPGLFSTGSRELLKQGAVSNFFRTGAGLAVQEGVISGVQNIATVASEKEGNLLESLGQLDLVQDIALPIVGGAAAVLGLQGLGKVLGPAIRGIANAIPSKRNLARKEADVFIGSINNKIDEFVNETDPLVINESIEPLIRSIGEKGGVEFDPQVSLSISDIISKSNTKEDIAELTDAFRDLIVSGDSGLFAVRMENLVNEIDKANIRNNSAIEINELTTLKADAEARLSQFKGNEQQAADMFKKIQDLESQLADAQGLTKTNEFSAKQDNLLIQRDNLNQRINNLNLTDSERILKEIIEKLNKVIDEGSESSVSRFENQIQKILDDGRIDVDRYTEIRELVEDLNDIDELIEVNRVSDSTTGTNNLGEGFIDESAVVSLNRQIAKARTSYENLIKGTNISETNLQSVIEISDEIAMYDDLIATNADSLNNTKGSVDLANEVIIDDIIETSGNKRNKKTEIVGVVNDENIDKATHLQISTGRGLISRKIGVIGEISEYLSKSFVDSYAPIVNLFAERGIATNTDALDWSSTVKLYVGQTSVAKRNVGNEFARIISDSVARLKDKTGFPIDELKIDIQRLAESRRSLGLDHERIMKNSVAEKNISDIQKKYGKNFNGVDQVRKDLVMFNKNNVLNRLLEAKVISSKEHKLLDADENYVPIFRKVDDKMVEIDYVNATKGSIIKELDEVDGEINDVFDSIEKRSFKTIDRIAQSKAQEKFVKNLEVQKANPETKDFFDNYEITKAKGNKIEPGENAFVTKIDGELVKVTSRRRDLIEPLMFLPSPATSFTKFSTVFQGYNNYASFLLTRANPAFKLVSVARDYIEGLMTYRAMGGKGFIAPWDVANGAKAYINHKRGIVNADTIMAKEAEELGLFTSNFGRESEAIFNDSVGKGKAKFQLFSNKLENVLDSMERGNRLAIYKQARKEGATKLKAAAIAKESLINFDKKGSKTKLMRPFFLFFNAIVQGNANLTKALTTPKSAVPILAATASAVYGIEQINSSIEPDWKQYVDSFELSSNMVFVTGREEDENGNTVSLNTFKVPLPLSLRPIWGAELNVLEYMNGNIDEQKVMSDFVTDMLNTLSPTGNEFIDASGESTGLNLVTPSLLKPVVNYANNRNFFGSELVPTEKDSEGNMVIGDLPEDYGDSPDEATSLFLSNFINGILKDESQWSDPRRLDELMKGYIFMGTTRDTIKAGKIIERLKAGEEFDNRDVPGYNRFFGSTNKNNQFFRDRDVFVTNINKAQTPELKERLLFEQLLKDTTKDRLSFGQRQYAIDQGVEGVPEIYFNSFSTSERSLASVNFLLKDVTESGDPILKQQKENYLESLQINKPDEYKRYIEWEIATNGMINNSKEDIQEYMESRGVIGEKPSMTVIQDKYFMFKRQEVGRQEDYAATGNIKDILKTSLQENGDTLIDENLVIESVQKLRKLEEDGLVRSAKARSVEKSLYNDYAEKTFLFYRNKLLSGEISVGEMLELVRVRDIPEATELAVTFINNNNY